MCELSNSFQFGKYHAGKKLPLGSGIELGLERSRFLKGAGADEDEFKLDGRVVRLE